MKKSSSLFLILLLCIWKLSAQDTMYVLKSGKVLYRQAISDVDSIVFYPPCIPKTCLQLGKSCGIWEDGCGNKLDCGSPKTCALLGKTCGIWDDGCGNKLDCGSPKTCAQLGKTCGIWDDGCGNKLDCGSPKTCARLGKTCGIWDDGCGNKLDCGTCPP